jgi:type I restriction enzyme M protein
MIMTDEQKRQLEKQLWAVANVLRGKMNADEYKNYILGFIFYKYLSEKLGNYVDKELLANEDFNFAEIKEETREGQEYLEEIKAACLSHLGFFLKPTELFSHLVAKGKGNKGQDKFILEDLKKVLNSIEQTSMGTASEDDFKGLFADVELTSTKLGSGENKKNEVIVDVLSLLNEIDFNIEDPKSDLLGDAYEYLIGEFAAGAGKKGGEFYTPSQVSRLLAQIVSEDKKRIRSAYDPTCGSGSLLLRLRDYTDVVDYYGQELNQTTYNLARMNMILHGVHFDHFKIKQGDTLTDDLHEDLKAEAIVANPPFAVNWKSDADPQLKTDERFSQYGRLAPKGAADYAFVTHMIHHLADNGTMAIVLPHGVLFRGGAEGQIRKYIIEKQNYLDAAIGLPANLFYGTSIPACVLVFKKCRKTDGDILFIDASREYEKRKNQNFLTNENIAKIFDTYKNRKEIDKYSHKATLDEIKENDFNLNIPRYVDTFEPEPEIDLDEVVTEIKKIDTHMIEVDKKISDYCKELNIKSPF